MLLFKNTEQSQLQPLKGKEIYFPDSLKSRQLTFCQHMLIIYCYQQQLSNKMSKKQETEKIVEHSLSQVAW